MENPEIRNPESGIRNPESGTGTRTGEINECFKLGSMININTTFPFSTFLARWMMVLGDWVWDDALIIQNIFAYVCRSRQHRGIGWNVSSTWVCYGCYYTEQQSNEQQTKNTLKKNLKYVESIIIVSLALVQKKNSKTNSETKLDDP